MHDSRKRIASRAARRPRAAIALLVATLAGVLAGLGGCRQPLFSERDERTQFDRYDKSRDQFAQQYVEDEFGRKEPNLWGRLRPKD